MKKEIGLFTYWVGNDRIYSYAHCKMTQGGGLRVYELVWKEIWKICNQEYHTDIDYVLCGGVCGKAV